MNKKIWVKGLCCLLGLLLCSMTLLACSRNEERKSTQQADGQETQENKGSMELETNIDTNKEEFAEDAALLPDVSIVKEADTYLCHDMNAEVLKKYQDSLAEQGYLLYKEEAMDVYSYLYYKNAEKRVQIIDMKDVAIVSIVKSDKSVIAEEELITNEEAMQLIKNYDRALYHTKEDGMENIVEASVVVKNWVTGLYDKTGFLLYSTYLANGNRTGTYIIYENKAYQIFDSLEDVCVADIDKNGTYELISLNSEYKTGVYRKSLNVYQVENPIYFNSLNKVLHLNYTNCFVGREGYGMLGLEKISDEEVHLIEVDEIYEQNVLTKKPLKDYGKLVIAEDRIHILPEQTEEFPYYQWDYDYMMPESDTKDAEVKTMDEIPQITVIINDIKLNCVGRKVNWNTEEEESIEFSDLLQADSTPQFASPDTLFNDMCEICLTFEDTKPTKITVKDYLITEGGGQQYGAEVGEIERAVRYGKDEKYYVGLTQHMALYLSSSSNTYTNPSYRGFRVLCEFGENQVCEYVFVLSMAPAW
ncbi:hypothetical protein [Anaerosporobacter sp.]|uniref:hypothetical protein n=1 Tax=Anaerosporobacter sp. TaxID=1872529 RepID=UPI00286ED7BA|nr:hypothetical protein [Anaerosporobacter sp.]